MYIKKIILDGFRNYDNEETIFSENINMITGENAQGKTNLLESIYFTSFGKSFRTVRDRDMIGFGRDYCRVKADYIIEDEEEKAEIALAKDGRKAAKINGRKVERISEMINTFLVVIFSPEDLGLIREGPSVRRRYLDMMISQISRRYFIALQQYRTGLDQRNAILRNLKTDSSAGKTMLGVFEEAMARSAAEIIRERRRIVSVLSEIARETYLRISGTEEQLRINYHSSVKEEENVEESLCRLLRENRDDDVRLGMTSVGPHRDDLILSLDKNQMKQFASQGQVRTAALSMKLSQMKILKDDSGEEPILLLDDVMSELDRKRRASLINEILSFQTFITCADREDVDCDKVSRIWQVSAVDGLASLVKWSEHENVSRET